MAITNQQNESRVQGLFPAVGPNPTDAGGLFRQAVDGGRNACFKVASGEGGPDFVCTAVTTAADTVTFDIPWASLMKLYAAQQANATFMVIKVKTTVAAAAIANSQYTEQIAVFQDVAGTMTLTGTTAVSAQIGAATLTVLSNSGTNFRAVVTETGAVAHNVRVEVFVNHVQ